MSLYRREGSPFWWYSFTVRGVRFRGSTGKEGKREAQLVEAEERQRLSKQRGRNDAWRLREVFGAYWQEHGRHADSADDIFFYFDIMSEFFGADLPAADMTNARIMDYRAARRGGGISYPPREGEEKRRPGRPVRPQTVNRDLSYLQAAMNHARDLHGKAIPVIAWKRLKVKEAPHRIRYAGGDEFVTLLKVAHERIRPIILCAVTTGLRRSNILSLEWHQVDLRSSRITLPHTKGDKPHMVQIAPVLRAELGRTPPKARKGKVFDTTNFRKRWEAALKAAEMEDFRFHDLRHTFASWARQNGADIADICDALNHSSVSVTMRYAHIKPEESTTAFDRVAAIFTAPAEQRNRA